VAFILIVDANEAHAARASDVLNAAGHACGWVASAERALMLLRWRVPELILLDQAIPGADGGTLPQRLRGTAKVPALPIILLTTDHAAPCLGTGGNAVLDEIRKPFDPGFLAWRIGHALGAARHAGNEAVQSADKGGRSPKLRSLA
jgi:DNA-binding response OmpR family regulator